MRRLRELVEVAQAMAFDWIYGQQHAVSVLRSALRTDAIPGAFLFVGPPGVGKQFTAMQLIKSLNCQKSADDSCDECPNCRLIDRQEFPDLFIPEKRDGRLVKGSTATDGGKGYLVDIMSRLSFAPVMGKRKVVLLNPADALTSEAANMLLKSVEEPPARTHFILVTTLESGVLPTLVSRCQRLRFPPLSEETVRVFLEKQGFHTDVAAMAARASGGSITHGKELCQGTLVEKKLEIVDFLLGYLSAPLGARAENAILMLESLADTERNSVALISSITTLLARDLLHVSSGMDQQQILFSERHKRIEKLAAAMGRSGVLDFARLAHEVTQGLARNENPRHLMYCLGNQGANLAGKTGG
jgi:DNA polymerase III subunit delta'